jgi:hypothetical protein
MGIGVRGGLLLTVQAQLQVESVRTPALLYLLDHSYFSLV